jgi:hypothetical protein
VDFSTGVMGIFAPGADRAQSRSGGRPPRVSPARRDCVSTNPINAGATSLKIFRTASSAICAGHYLRVVAGLGIVKVTSFEGVIRRKEGIAYLGVLFRADNLKSIPCCIFSITHISS